MGLYVPQNSEKHEKSIKPLNRSRNGIHLTSMHNVTATSREPHITHSRSAQYRRVGSGNDRVIAKELIRVSSYSVIETENAPAHFDDIFSFI